METLAVQRHSPDLSLASHEFKRETTGRTELTQARLEDAIIDNAHTFGAEVQALRSIARSIDTASAWLSGAGQSVAEGRVQTLHFSDAAVSHAHRQVIRVAEGIQTEMNLAPQAMQVLDHCLLLGRLMGQAAQAISSGIKGHSSHVEEPFSDFVRDAAAFEQQRQALLGSLKRSV